jgi:ribosomal protein S18 acetylase RimI-like enzyme
MEILQKLYPKKVTLKGKTLTVRPLVKEDEKALLSFFNRIPAEDRNLLKDDVLDAKTIAKWCKTLDYARILPMLALDGERVVGDATLHREEGWMSHVARVRAVVDPEYRGFSVGRVLVQEFLTLAPDIGLRMVDAEIMAEQVAGQRMFEALGFSVVARLPAHALDRRGKAHDVVVLSHPV